MNAKELADKLDIKDASSQDIEVAKMLCQQADKINVLEMIEMFKDNCIQRLEEDLTHSLELNKVQRNQIARLKAKIEKLNLLARCVLLLALLASQYVRFRHVTSF